ncbi:WD repeat-containing protein CG11141 [Musca vetustissima]|uniref:WD repeat-containing protein CG11141 n=1 Tax=Musca vetustissima TaxID=27455 RepID=UPI002AB7C558|nr:WD repeat-containing protein CG11141 [Musca vetustissima]
MNSKELYTIREWAPLTDVFDRIPTRISRGLFPADLNITCVDAIEEFIALGSDAGIIFWYNRDSGQIQKLKSENTSRITCVKIVNSVEYMVAAGNSTGQVSVFQIQKELPADLNLVAPCTKAKPIERYTIRDLHQSPISCCEWSKNGMKLYSGDRNGVVVLTELDYQTHISKSVEILNEAYEIVQLSVHLGHLLVSTLYRSIVCSKDESGNWVVKQIGKKDRKQLVDCGGTFFKKSSGRKPRLICGRPNLRFWLADVDGNVEKTLLFREAVALSPTWEIPILNPKCSMLLNRTLGNTQTLPADDATAIGDSKNFRNIYSYGGQDSLIVTHDERTLYILNLDRLKVEAVARGFRKIIDFCVCNKEIFVLEGERSLLRLAPMPEKPNKIAKIIYNPSMPPPVPVMGSSICGTFEAPVEYEPEEQPILNAEECFELPPIETLNLNIPIELAVESSKAEQNRRLEVFKEISEMDFDEAILHHSGISLKQDSSTNKKRRKSRERGGDTQNVATEGIVEIGHIVEAEHHGGKSMEYTAESTQMDVSYCNDANNGNGESISTMTLNLKEAFNQHFPNILSPTTLKETIAEKAKSLAEELNLPEVKLEPITDEELRMSKYLAQPPAPQPPLVSPLETIYPTESLFKKDSSIQTTPHQKIYYIEEQTMAGDFSNGQPIEDICHTLRATNLIESNNDNGEKEEEKDNKKHLAFVNAQLKEPDEEGEDEGQEEIKSFLLDFNKVKDPLAPSAATCGTTAASTKSENESSNGSSSEWEFLDN